MQTNPWKTGGYPTLNVAATCASTQALGPGNRAVVWVQGCALHCPGCIAGEWTAFHQGRLVSPEELAEELLVDPDVDGLTLSGGEPFLQAAGLAKLIAIMRQQRDLTVISYTGYTLEFLRAHPPAPGADELLNSLDVLIDGPYQAQFNTGRGLRGSLNQRVHHFTTHLTHFNFTTGRRMIDVQISQDTALFVGIPPLDLPSTFDLAMQRVNGYLVGI